MKIQFQKYQATGNDFVLIDNRSGAVQLTLDQIRHICNRRLGVGADGLMLIESHPSEDFRLQYFNSDGSQSLCGNGSRAAVHMAASLGIVKDTARFEAFDGVHEASLTGDNTVRLKMADVGRIERIGGDFFIDTGSPHYVKFVTRVREYPVVDEGRRIRYDAQFAPGGTNVNFVEIVDDNSIFVRTYERGVEDETLSCGTGVTAAAIAASYKALQSPIAVATLGGHLSVEFSPPPDGLGAPFSDVYLIGPARSVFTGQLEI